MIKISNKSNSIFILFICVFVTLLGANNALSSDKSWEKHFVKNESDIPINKFRAYYFDEQTAGIVRYTELVDRPAVNFVRKFHNINAENFGAYWIGYLEFSEQTTMSINVYKSRAEAKILIDGENISKRSLSRGNLRKTTDYTFSPGKHKIEIQYVSNYFSVSFLVSLLPQITIFDDVSLKEALHTISDPSILYCGAYESDRFDMSVDVNIKPSNRPTILFLSSYQPIVWRMQNIEGSNLKTIILSSYSPRSTVANLPDGVTVLHYDNLPYVYELVSKNSSSSNKRNTFKNLAYTIQDLTGYKPNGFSGKYGLVSVTIPEIVLDKTQYALFGLKFNRVKSSSKKSNSSRLDMVFE